MDRLVEIRLMIEGLNAQKQEISSIEETLINEYNSIVVQRQEDAKKVEEEKTNKSVKRKNGLENTNEIVKNNVNLNIVTDEEK